ncbi:MAG: BON domain-containing protein [Gammaproteobacteria bacterium]|nr:BON domain-containing protein [Gammaproteobacteria bacterium]
MKSTILAFLVGLIVGGAGLWYLLQNPEIIGLSRAPTQVAEAPATATDDLRAALRLRAEDIQQELARTGQIVRRNAVELASEVAGAADDTRITASIKARFATDRDLAAFPISVSTSNGRVSLSGTVDSPELIGRAVTLAMGTRGVREVVATLRVESA